MDLKLMKRYKLNVDVRRTIYKRIIYKRCFYTIIFLFLVPLAYFTTIQCFYYLVCDLNPCMNNGTCANAINKANCTCAGGFTGDKCETEPEGNTTI